METGKLTVRSNGRETPLHPGINGEQVLLDDATVSGLDVNASSLVLTNGSILTHLGTDASAERRLQITVGTLTISTNSRIDVTARGYVGGARPGNGAQAGFTLGNVTTGGSTRRNGGAYGGMGAIGSAGGSANALYGDFKNPNELGSGGGSDAGEGGNGGGLIRIQATHILHEGRIMANGENGSATYGGGGSGGGIFIQSSSYDGIGEITAIGGQGGTIAGGGGGGRIAILVANASNIAEPQALGGGGGLMGGPGTIYIRRGSSLGEVLIAGAGRETPLPATLSNERIVIRNSVVSATNLTVTSLTLTNGTVLTHPPVFLGGRNGLRVNASTMFISTDSRIDVVGRGYPGAQTSENSGQRGFSFGDSNLNGSLRRNGGSYGGYGGHGSAEYYQNHVYGSFRQPNDFGSGGGSDSGPGGYGGGLVVLNVPNLTIDGAIVANGADGSTYGGGGSGGAIRLAVTTLNGSGNIRANGGAAGSNSGGGGGGRIAIYFQNAGFDRANVFSYGGPGGVSAGSPGTVYVTHPTALLGELSIAGQTNASSRPTQLISLDGSGWTSVEANRLVNTNASFAPGSLIGLELRPDAAAIATYTVVSNSVDEIFTDPLDGDVRTVASVGDSYAATPRLTSYRMANAWVEFVDGDLVQSNRLGSLNAISSTISSNSILTHPAATGISQFGVKLVVEDRLLVDATSRIDVNGRGYLGGDRPGNPSQRGRTFGNTNTDGSTRRVGGSFGGLGGIGSVGGTANATYGGAEFPAEPGSGGGSDLGWAGSGGGYVQIEARNFILDGELTALGENGSTYGGGGSGGGILINALSLSGSGWIRANGGAAGGASGAGGGGRIAVYYENADSFDFTQTTAVAGGGAFPAVDGTVYLSRRDFDLGPQSLTILGIRSVPQGLSVLKSSVQNSAQMFVLYCAAPSPHNLVLEHSKDLVNWAPVATEVEVDSSGQITVTFSVAGQLGFVRLKVQR
jgi:hypothetical protein